MTEETVTVTFEVPKSLLPEGVEVIGYTIDQYVPRPYLVLADNEMYLEGLRLTVKRKSDKNT